jgi:16S rRNA (cytosine1402-N4)-methyltransferase
VTEHVHEPVLLEEVLEALVLQRDGTYIDCTFGRGGHTASILGRLGSASRVLAIDRDPAAVEAGWALAAGDSRLELIHGDFACIGSIAEVRGLGGKVDGILFDLGVSLPQLRDAARGFSFSVDGPLDMRIDPTSGAPASEWLARAGEREIEYTLREFGEERYARRIARAIVAERRNSPIRTTGRLAEIVTRHQPRRDHRQHPATRVFQAIRIRVNDELRRLESALRAAVDVLRPTGRLVVVSFHSLEDRIVKRFMRAAAGRNAPDGPTAGEGFEGRLRIVCKPVRPGESETRRNPRARSAIMRVAEKVR